MTKRKNHSPDFKAKVALEARRVEFAKHQFYMANMGSCTKFLRDMALVLGVVLIWDLFRVL